MSQVLPVSQKTLHPENTDPILDSKSMSSELPFQEISQGLYKEISESLLKAQENEDGTVPGFCICCVQGCCVSHCCIQCMNMN